MHSDHRGEDAERNLLLIILMRDEYACTVEESVPALPARLNQDVEWARRHPRHVPSPSPVRTRDRIR